MIITNNIDKSEIEQIIDKIEKVFVDGCEDRYTINFASLVTDRLKKSKTTTFIIAKINKGKYTFAFLKSDYNEGGEFDLSSAEIHDNLEDIIIIMYGLVCDYLDTHEMKDDNILNRSTWWVSNKCRYRKSIKIGMYMYNSQMDPDNIDIHHLLKEIIRKFIKKTTFYEKLRNRTFEVGVSGLQYNFDAKMYGTYLNCNINFLGEYPQNISFTYNYYTRDKWIEFIKDICDKYKVNDKDIRFESVKAFKSLFIMIAEEMIDSINFILRKHGGLWGILTYVDNTRNVIGYSDDVLGLLVKEVVTETVAEISKKALGDDNWEKISEPITTNIIEAK